MIFELTQDFHDALAAIPHEHPRRRILELFEEAIRRDIYFINRHPTTLFQCMWNLCWWYDCPQAAQHYEEPEGGWTNSAPWWDEPEPKLHQLLEGWRVERALHRGAFPWARSLRPPAMHLGTPQEAVFRGHRDWVSVVAFSPDGARIASGSKDKTVRIWNLATGQELACLRLQDTVLSLVFSPDGTLLITGGGLDEPAVRVWDATTGYELVRLRGHEKSFTVVALSPDGLRLHEICL